MKKICYYIFIFVFTLIVFTPVYKGEKLYDSYETEIGITINSYSDNWTGHRLKEVYNELLNNTHGEEIHYLKEINLFPTNPKGGKEEGIYNAMYSKVSLFSRDKIVISKENSIELYNMKYKDKVEDIARTLSHEYGHHFTLYYLIKYENKTFEQWDDTLLSQAREASRYPKIVGDYSNGHMWSFIEICAEDYVQLYGSSLAKQVHNFQDIQERYENGNINNSLRYDYSIYNLSPQENNSIPLALSLPSLIEYWQTASGLEISSNILTAPAIALTRVEDIGHKNLQYLFQWNKSFSEEDNEAKFYTVVAQGENGEELIPIKTVERGEPRQAIIGSVKAANGNRITYYTDSFINEPKRILVYAIDESGGVVSSNELYIDFNKPNVSQLHEEKVYTQESSILNIPETIEEEGMLTRYIYKLIGFLIHTVKKI